jgi:hypothetical protein
LCVESTDFDEKSRLLAASASRAFRMSPSFAPGSSSQRWTSAGEGSQWCHPSAAPTASLRASSFALKSPPGLAHGVVPS